MVLYQSADQSNIAEGAGLDASSRADHSTSGPWISVGHMSYQPPSLVVHSILDALLTGSSVEELLPRMNALPATERAALLCSTCAMIDELAIICRDVRVEAERVLVRNCRFFQPGNFFCHATCEREQPEPPSPE